MRALEKRLEDEETGGESGLFQGWVSVSDLSVEDWAEKMGVCQAVWLIVEATTAVACRLDHLFLFLSRRDLALLFLVCVLVQILILIVVCLLSCLSNFVDTGVGLRQGR